MSKVLITSSKLDHLANTISAKSGAALPLTIAEMDAAVESISGVTVEALNVTQNGTYTAQSGKAYSPVTVAVPSGVDTSSDTVDAAHLLSGYTAHDASGSQITGSYTPPTFTTQTKSATPSETAQTITPDSGYDGLSSVSVGAISSTYVGSGITRRTSSNLTASGATVTAPAGYYDAAATKSVASGSVSASATKSISNHAATVTPSASVTAGYISSGTTGTAVTVSASELVSGTYTVDSSGTKDVTNYASASVAAGGATASATKGTVSNHSVTVTPSVTKTAGYITAGTASGTAVTVSASELVSGSQTITDNGTVNVTNLASVTVAIPFVTYYTSSSTPTSSQGSDNDIWLVV